MSEIGAWADVLWRRPPYAWARARTRSLATSPAPRLDDRGRADRLCRDRRLVASWRRARSQGGRRRGLGGNDDPARAAPSMAAGRGVRVDGGAGGRDPGGRRRAGGRRGAAASAAGALLGRRPRAASERAGRRG